jgi:rhomboid-like protein
MSLLRFSRPSLHALCSGSRSFSPAPFRSATSHLQHQLRQRSQRTNPQRPPPPSRQSPPPPQQGTQEDFIREDSIRFEDNPDYAPKYVQDAQNYEFPKVRIQYVRPAIWCLAVSVGIYTGCAYLDAKDQVAKLKNPERWLQAPQWAVQSRGPPTPTELATKWWEQQNPISKLSCGIIAANSAVHLTSFVLPRFWDSLWHIPARNVSYTNFTSMFVHSGPMHLLFNMWATWNFMLPVGYSRLFEGNTYHTLSFFLSAGVLSGFAQHWSTIFARNTRAIPEIFIRGGGASGALFGILGAFCMEYPTAELGILFLPFKFEAQYFFPAVMLFDFIGMVRGYSFVNFGHAVSIFIHTGLLQLTPHRLTSLAHSLVWATRTSMARTRCGSRLSTSGNAGWRVPRRPLRLEFNVSSTPFSMNRKPFSDRIINQYQYVKDCHRAPQCMTTHALRPTQNQAWSHSATPTQRQTPNSKHHTEGLYAQSFTHTTRTACRHPSPTSSTTRRRTSSPLSSSAESSPASDYHERRSSSREGQAGPPPRPHWPARPRSTAC